MNCKWNARLNCTTTHLAIHKKKPTLESCHCLFVLDTQREQQVSTCIIITRALCFPTEPFGKHALLHATQKPRPIREIYRRGTSDDPNLISRAACCAALQAPDRAYVSACLYLPFHGNTNDSIDFERVNTHRAPWTTACICRARSVPASGRLRSGCRRSRSTSCGTNSEGRCHTQ